MGQGTCWSLPLGGIISEKVGVRRTDSLVPRFGFLMMAGCGSCREYPARKCESHLQLDGNSIEVIAIEA